MGKCPKIVLRMLGMHTMEPYPLCDQIFEKMHPLGNQFCHQKYNFCLKITYW